ncbi:MAG: DNA polymerase III subunit delta [Candidatus Magasanikbacteria bacterium]
MIIYIHGADTFRSRQYLKEQVERFKQTRDPQGYNVVFVDGKKSEPGKVLSEVISTPFLSEKRLVVIENILSTSDKELLVELIRRIKDNKIPESNIIIFWQGEGLGKVKEIKELEGMLKKEKYAQEFSLLVGVQLTGFIASEIKKRGAKISTTAINYLAQNAGKDGWFLNSLLDQLCAFGGEKEIGVPEINLFLEEKVDDNVFNMVEAIVSGNKKQAYKLLTEQRRLGEDDFKLFGLIVWQFRILLQMRSLFEQQDNITSDIIAKELGLHPFVVKKNLSLVKKYNKQQMVKIYDQLLNMDFKAKTGQADLGLMLDLFIGKN